LEADRCQEFSCDREKVRRVQEGTDFENVKIMTDIFRALSDETRARVALALCGEEELCVCDVSTILGTSTATASHHLRSLHRLGLARKRKEGRYVYYSLPCNHIRQIIIMAYNHCEESIHYAGQKNRAPS